MPADNMHADEVATDADLVGRLIAGQFPRWSGIPIRRIRSNGTVNALYRLGDDMVVRLPRIDFAREDVDEQFSMLETLAPFLPVAVPAPLAKGAPAAGYPWAWSVYRWIDGENPTAGTTGDLTLARDLAGFITALRRVDPTGGPPSGRGVHLATRDGATRSAIDALDGMADAAAVTAVWEQSLLAPAWDGPPVWVHGDLLPDNLLVSAGRLTGVIDFGAAGVGDPACDVIPAWSVLSAGGRRVFREALAVDDATWTRGRGWALSIAVIILPYYRHTHPAFVALATRMVDEILSDRSS